MNDTTPSNDDACDHAEENARGWLESIRELVERLNDTFDANAARDAIYESVLSVEVSYGEWVNVGARPTHPTKFQLLLSTGGPALRIVGELHDGDPCNAKLEKQDWYTPWTVVRLSPDERRDVEAFVACFCFGE